MSEPPRSKPNVVVKQGSSPLPDHPSQDMTARHADDQELRKWGFRIASRPADGSPTWKREGKVYSQIKAEELVREMKGRK